MFISTHGIIAGKGISGDSDADAFIAAAGITDSTQKSAIQTLVTDLKGYGIWTKMKAIYPMIGGTASTHKWNLKDPRDLDAAFRLVFNGGWTHSSTGAKPNGTTGYGDTKLRASTVLSNSNSHIGTYIRTTPNNGVLIGDNSTQCFLQLTTNVYYGALASSLSSISQTNNAAFYMVNKPSSTSQKLIRNSSILLNDTKGLIGFTSGQNIFLGAYASNSTFSDAEISFSSIGDSMTDSEAVNFYTAIQAYQTTLSRNI